MKWIGNWKISNRAGFRDTPKDQEKESRNHSIQFMVGIAGQNTTTIIAALSASAAVMKVSNHAPDLVISSRLDVPKVGV